MAKRVIEKPKPNTDDVVTIKMLGQLVSAKRTSKGMKIRDTAQLCNMSVQTLQKIEHGDGSVKTERLFHALQMLGIKLSVQE